MTLIDDIARMEAAARSHFVKPEVAEEPTRELPMDKITLDPKLDPDPYNLHGMSLSYRLKCMGWP
jgi:hypothetical protein